MCANASQPFDLVGEPLPEINMFFKNQKDGKMPSDLHRELATKDIKGYKENGQDSHDRIISERMESLLTSIDVST